VTAPKCPTIARLASLKPGESFRYLSYAEHIVTGPLCQDLRERIHHYAHGLALVGRVELKTERYPAGKGKNAITITDFIATGKERSRVRQ
jgi:hypothetical protein